MSKRWTPGPWRINKYGSIGAGETGCLPIVAHAEPEWGPSDLAKEYPHNAVLIAVAPELYEALYDFANEIRAYQSPECEDDAILGPLLKNADAVLRKARGEQ